MKNIRLIAIGVVFLLLVMISSAGKQGGQTMRGVIVQPGNVALVINHYTGRVKHHILRAGWNAQPPFSGNEIIEVPTYTRTYTMVRQESEGAHKGDDSVMVNTLSANTLQVDCSVSYHIEFDPRHEEKLIDLYQKYRTQFQDNFANFEEVQLRPSFRQAINDAFGLKNTADCMTGNGKRVAAEYARRQLNQQFNPDSIIIDDVRIRAIYPDDATVTALRSRLQAQQSLRLAKLDLQLNQIQNKREILEAQAIADATRIRAASLTDQLVQVRHVKDINIVGVPESAIVNLPATAPTP